MHSGFLQHKKSWEQPDRVNFYTLSNVPHATEIVKLLDLEDNFKDHLVQIPIVTRGLSKCLYSLIWNTSRHETFTASLGNLFWVSLFHHPIYPKSTLFQLKTVTICSITVGLGKKFLFMCLISPLYRLKRLNKMSPEHSPGLITSILPAFLHTRGAPALWPFLCPSYGPTQTDQCLYFAGDSVNEHSTLVLELKLGLKISNRVEKFVCSLYVIHENEERRG